MTSASDASCLASRTEAQLPVAHTTYLYWSTCTALSSQHAAAHVALDGQHDSWIDACKSIIMLNDMPFCDYNQVCRAVEL